MLSKVIPSSFGLDVVGIVVPLTLIGSGLLTSLEKVVNVVAVDFPGDSWRCLFLSHSARVVRYPFIRLQSGGVVGPDVSSDMSSAYEIILISGGGVGALAMIMLNRVGDRIPPWGTPHRTILDFDLAPLNSTYWWRPCK